MSGKSIASPASANGSATHRSLPGYGCSTGSPARIPRQKPIASGSEKRTGYSARSLASKSTGPAATSLDDTENAPLIELLCDTIEGSRFPLG